MSTSAAGLEVRGLEAAAPGGQVLQGVDLSVAPGCLLALLGANGAGKTTVLHALCGLVPRSAGSVTVDGVPVPARPDAAARSGVVLVPPDRGTLASLSVQDNLRVAMLSRGRAARAREPGDLSDVYRWFPALAARRRAAAGQLSGGEQQMLAVARGLLTRPRVLLLDEPSLGLSPRVAGELFATLDEIRREEGLSVLLVEQNARLALEIADHAVVLASGAVSVAAPARELLSREDVVHAYLG